MKRMKIAVLTPVGRYLSTEHQRSVDVLVASHGAQIIREYGITCVDQARSVLLARALGTDADIIFWIDDDIAFDPNDVVKMSTRCMKSKYDILAAAYARRLPVGGINVRVAGKQTLKFFQPGLVDAVAVGFGFTAMKRASLESMSANIPKVNMGIIRSGKAGLVEVAPLFASRVVDGLWLTDDESFCDLARRQELKIGLDLEPRVWHIGAYAYGLEDSALSVERVGTLIVETQ